MAAHDSNQDEHAEGEHGHGGVLKYLAVFGALCALTATSFMIGSSKALEDAPAIAGVAMMAISCAKAMLVMMFFMHLIWEASWKYVLTIPASIMAIFLMLMLVPDVGRRTKYYSDERLLHAADPQVQSEHHGDAAGQDDHKHGDDHDNHGDNHGDNRGDSDADHN